MLVYGQQSYEVEQRAMSYYLVLLMKSRGNETIEDLKGRKLPKIGTAKEVTHGNRHSHMHLHNGLSFRCSTEPDNLRQCCRVKKALQLEMLSNSRENTRTHKRTGIAAQGQRYRSADALKDSSKRKINFQSKINSQGSSRQQTLGQHYQGKKKTTPRVYILPNLPEFSNEELLDEVDQESRHKIVVKNRPSRLQLYVKQQLQSITPVKQPAKGKVTQYQYLENASYEASSYVGSGQEVKKFPLGKGQPSAQEVNVNRPYYRHLENMDTFMTPLRKALCSTPSQTATLSDSVHIGYNPSTLFHSNKLKFSYLSNNSKISSSKQQHFEVPRTEQQHFEVPRTEQQLTQFIGDYQPIQDTFDLKALLKKGNFQIVNGQEEVYFGQVTQGQRHGKGIVISRKETFQGIFDQGVKSKGAQRTKDGIYIGFFQQGKRHGIGRFKWTNGQQFQGEWKYGQKDGYGTWKSPKGDHYEGEWKGNSQYGKGTYLHLGGSKYTGNFKCFLKHGKGEQEFANGDKYTGDYNKGQAHGYGQYSWVNGDVYKGDFKDGSRTGQGLLVMQTGDNYEGSFENDQKQGVGKQKYHNGEYFVGEFKEGDKVKGSLFSKKGVCLEQL